MGTKVVDIRKEKLDAKTELPLNQTVLHVSYTDPNTERLYAGEFTVRRLTMGLISKANVRRAQLNGGQNEAAMDDVILQFHMMVAHLEMAIVEAPSWWKPMEFYDVEPIAAVYEEVMNFEDSFRKPVQKSTPGSEAPSQSKTEPSESHAPKVVVPEVPPPASFGGVPKVHA